MKEFVIAVMTILLANVVHADAEWSEWSCTNRTVVCGDSQVSFEVDEMHGTGAVSRFLDGGTADIPSSIHLSYYRSRTINDRCEEERKTVEFVVTGICQYAFFGSPVTNVVIPSSVVSIDRDAAEEGCHLNSVCISDVAAWCRIAFANYKSNPLVYAGNLYENGVKTIDLVIPQGVASIAAYAFEGCSMSSVTIPSSVKRIGSWAFGGFGEDWGDGNLRRWCCRNLSRVNISDIAAWCDIAFDDEWSNPLCYGGELYLSGQLISYLVIPESVTNIGQFAFYGCRNITSVTIPANVTAIGTAAFQNCTSLKDVIFQGNAPVTGTDIFANTPEDMIVHVKGDSTGWTQWNGRQIRIVGAGAVNAQISLTVTNVVVHYIQRSELSPMAAPLTKDVGIVNVMTEIKGGIVSIPDSWATNYSGFAARFGDDFLQAIAKPTGKIDAGGKQMFVWQDYVAGTDPMDENDKFTASVTMVDGKPKISYRPILSDTETVRRIYKTFGKVRLQDEDWVEIPAGHYEDFNFFKVTVEMR